MHGDLDIIRENNILKNEHLTSQVTKQLNEFVDTNNVVESLSLHLSQSIISNDQEIFDFCLKNPKNYKNSSVTVNVSSRETHVHP